MKTLLIVCSVLFTFTQTTFARAKATGDRKKAETCANVDWSQTTCKVFEKKGSHPRLEQYRSEDLGGYSLNLLLNVGSQLVETVGYLNRGFNHPCFDGQLRQLKLLATSIAAKAPLTDCQRACVTKCITANFLQYKWSGGEAFINSPCMAAEVGKGSCRAYSELADNLMGELNVQSRIAASLKMKHAYNAVTFGDETYYMEPQSSACEFFKAKPSEN